MSNASYCRFQNTLIDLRDCAENIRAKLSEEEWEARKKLLVICHELASYNGADLPLEKEVEE